MNTTKTEYTTDEWGFFSISTRKIHTSEHFGFLAEVLPPIVTGVSVPIVVHLEAEFIDKEIPIVQVKLSPLGNERDGDWTSVTISRDLVDIDCKLSPNEILLYEMPQRLPLIAYIRLNYLQLARIWEQGSANEPRLIKRLRKLPTVGWK